MRITKTNQRYNSIEFYLILIIIQLQYNLISKLNFEI
jgi:hypothetical protein